METRKTRGVGFIFYIILIAIIFVVVFAIRQNGKNAVNYTYEGFINDLADGKVKDVTISQNQEIPTGKITVKLSDDSKKMHMLMMSKRSRRLLWHITKQPKTTQL